MDTTEYLLRAFRDQVGFTLGVTNDAHRSAAVHPHCGIILWIHNES